MTDAHAVPFHLLPPLLQEIVGVIGLPATMLLVKAYGGVRIYIPANLALCNQDHPLAEIIGVNDLVKLSKYFNASSKQSTRFQIPKAQSALNAVRNGMMIRDSLTMTNRQIALKYRMTEDSVRRLLNTPEPEPPPQKSLF